MAAFRLFLCTIVATFCFCSLTNAAVLHNLISADKLTNVIDSGDQEESYLTFSDSIRARRSNAVQVCRRGVVCGWAIEELSTGKMNYMRNRFCNCPQSFTCVRSYRDEALSGYGYTCKANVTATDVVSPHVA